MGREERPVVEEEIGLQSLVDGVGMGSSSQAGGGDPGLQEIRDLVPGDGPGKFCEGMAEGVVNRLEDRVERRVLVGGRRESVEG